MFRKKERLIHHFILKSYERSFGELSYYTMERIYVMRVHFIFLFHLQEQRIRMKAQVRISSNAFVNANKEYKSAPKRSGSNRNKNNDFISLFVSFFN